MYVFMVLSVKSHISVERLFSMNKSEWFSLVKKIKKHLIKSVQMFVKSK